jgi:carboxypeptidase C (cathepsin A)
MCSYRKIISSSQYSSYLSKYNSQCLPALQKCPGTTGSNSQCVSADNTCYNTIEGPLSEAADFDVYDIRASSNDPNPPETYVSYLQSSKVQTAIGAKQKYQECPNAPYNAIANTGDDARSFLPALSQVVQSGIPVLLWAGDADWICNYMGGFAVANAVTYSGSSTFKSTALKPYTVQGTSYGLYKTVGNLNWLQVYAAGHEVPFYRKSMQEAPCNVALLTPIYQSRHLRSKRSRRS